MRIPALALLCIGLIAGPARANDLEPGRTCASATHSATLLTPEARRWEASLRNNVGYAQRKAAVRKP